MKQLEQIWDKLSDIGIEHDLEPDYLLKARMMNRFIILVAMITAIFSFVTIFVDGWFVSAILCSLTIVIFISVYFIVHKKHETAWHIILTVNSMFIAFMPVLIGDLPTLSTFLLLYYLMSVFLFDEQRYRVYYIGLFIVSLIVFQILYFSVAPLISLQMMMVANISAMISLAVMTLILMNTYRLEQEYQRGVITANENSLKNAQKIANLGSWDYDPVKDKMFWSDQMFELLEIPPNDYYTFNEVIDLFIPAQYKSIFLETLHKKDTFPTFNFKFDKKVNGQLKTFKLIGNKTFNEAGQFIKLSGVLQDITAVMKREQALAYSNSLTKAALDSTADGILIINNEGVVTGYNQKILDLWQLDHKMLDNATLANITTFLSQNLKDTDNTLDKILLLNQHPTLVSFDLIAFKDGTLYEVYSQPQRLKNEVVGRVWSFRDITIQESTKQELKQSLHFLQNILDSLPHPFFYKDENQRYVLCNSAFTDFLQLPADAIIGKTIKELNAIDIPIIHSTQDLNLLQKGGQVAYESTHLINGENSKSILSYKNVITDKDGKHKGIVGTVVDITERKKAQQKIQDSEIKFRSLFEQSPLGIAIDTTNGKLTGVNNQFCKMLGYTPEEFSIMTVADITHPADRDKHKDLYQNVLDGKLDSFSIDKRYVTKDGGILWAKVFINVAREEDGTYKYDIAMIQDITEQKRQTRKINTLLNELKKVNEALDYKVRLRTQELERSNEELLRSNQDLEQFAYVASHDLQEPLRMVSNFVQLIDKRYGDKIGIQGKTYISFAVQGAKRMSELIKNVLEYSRAGRKEGNMRVSNIDKIIRSKLFSLSRKIEEKKATIQINDNIPSELYCEPQLIGLVFQNLISNALKFNENENPMVIIDCEEQDEHWQFRVQDNGIGIAPQYQQKIFEIFKRLHGQAEYEGTGIGLSLCKKIVMRHKGEIWLDSVPNEGTTFYFTIHKELERKMTSSKPIVLGMMA